MVIASGRDQPQPWDPEGLSGTGRLGAPEEPIGQYPAFLGGGGGLEGSCTDAGGGWGAFTHG